MQSVCAYTMDFVSGYNQVNKKNKGLTAFDKDSTGCPIRDNLCFFRYLAYAKMGKKYDREVMTPYSKYRIHLTCCFIVFL